MKIKLLDTGKPINLSDDIFASDVKPALIHQAVVTQLAGERQGTKAQSTRAEVRGGGKKPWRQKGTGRARVGSSNNPLWRGGGVTFAAKPRSFKKKINRKMHQAALRGILTSLVKEKRLEVLSKIEVKNPKTKELVEFLKKNKLDYTKSKINLIVDQLDDNLLYASRNLPDVRVSKAEEISVALLVGADKSLITAVACEQIAKGLSK